VLLIDHFDCATASFGGSVSRIGCCGTCKRGRERRRRALRGDEANQLATFSGARTGPNERAAMFSLLFGSGRGWETVGRDGRSTSGRAER
jgi:hypothetical protein